MHNHSERFIKYYMDLAIRTSEMSYSKRAKVGAILVVDNSIVSTGYNGMPKGMDNCCEYYENNILHTRPEVIHAECNAIERAIERGICLNGASLFCNFSPCESCSDKILKNNIANVFYKHPYRIDIGVNKLKTAGVSLFHID